MKFAPFIYDWVSLQNYYEFSEDTNINEYFGFEIPFTKKDFDRYYIDSEINRKISDTIHNYLDEHNIYLIHSETGDYDLGEGWVEHQLTFHYDDKFYTFECIDTVDGMQYIDNVYPEAVETFPHEETRTIYLPKEE